MSPGLPSAWRTAWMDRRFRFHSAASLVLLVLVLGALTRFLEWVERREGVVLPDPLLRVIPPHDVTWLTFGIIYAGVLVGIGVLLFHPRALLIAVEVYIVMVLFRIGAMYLAPFSPPPDMIPLRDPFVEFFGTGSVLTKDLFFSGHTATLFLLFLVMPGRKLRTLFLILTAAVAVCVIVQHVHYGIDVYVAPFVTYVSYRLVRLLQGGDERGREGRRGRAWRGDV